MNQVRNRFSPAPRSTYRVQLTPEFGFDDARAIVPYLKRLGISDLYCSPFQTARPGSTHGYDVVDPLHLNPELGGEEAFLNLSRTLKDHGMGLLLDIVPNHMAASTENAWWLDVLENGPSSRYAEFFDVEWDPALPGGLENRVLLPILGSPYGDTLENGELSIESDDTGYHLRFYETHLPLSGASYVPILQLRSGEIERRLGEKSDDWNRLSQLIRDIEALSVGAIDEAEFDARRHQIRKALHTELPRLRQIPEIAEELNEAIQIINGTPGEPRSYDLLDQIVSMQAYRLAYWQLAREQINYRRFFDINDLISMRVENSHVFETTHQRILQLVSEGHVTGLRIDHLDGLWDPLGYLDRLQGSLRETDRSCHGRFVVVEKILAEGEELPEDWPIAGTTGYEFMNVLNELFVNPDGLSMIEQSYRDVTQSSESFQEMVHRAKLRVLDDSFAANVQSLSVLLGRIADVDRHGRDLTFNSLRDSVIEVTAALPVYRTYVNGYEISQSDRRWIESAVSDASLRRPDLRHALGFLRRVLLLEIPPYVTDLQREDWLLFVMRWQQLTGPAMAKGDEDTALYQFNRLVSLNEVGGRPDTDGTSIDEWHRWAERRQQIWPQTLNASSTHDTKRSEDVRARISVLSEMPDEWIASVHRWRELNAGKHTVRNGVPVPDPNVEWLIYQTLVGVWPSSKARTDDLPVRLKAYVTKAMRESKTHTSWTAVDAVYETAVLGFVDAILDPTQSSAFLDDFHQFQQRVAPLGAINSLSQLLLKLTAPGIPDVYQGTDLWDDSLVDPDNRRPVDYEARRRVLDGWLDGSQDTPELAQELARHWDDGRIKLWVLHRALSLRNDEPSLFSQSTYTPIDATDEAEDKAIAFAREHESKQVLVIAPRLVASLIEDGAGLRLTEAWTGAELRMPARFAGRWKNVFTGEGVDAVHGTGVAKIQFRDVFRSFPLGLLTRSDR